MLSLDQQNQLRERYRRRRPDWQPATELFAGLVRHYLRPGSRVLDVGCGRGGLVEQLEHPLAQIAGVDPDEASLREHRLPLPRVVARGGRLPFASGQFDLAYASWVLEHLERPLPDLQEIRRVLRPGGIFVFITPNAQHPLIRLNQLIGRMQGVQTAVVSRLYGRGAADTFPAYYRANRAGDLRRLGTAAGLHLVRLYTIPDPTYLALRPALLPLAIRLEQLVPPAWQLHLVGVFQAVW